MKRVLIITLALTFGLNLKAQNYNNFYGSVVANAVSNNILTDLTTFENFGKKNLGSDALLNTQNWILERYQSLGYTDIALQPFTYNGKTTNNIIITKTGTVYPNTFLIIDAHYDTINGPGTDDNGTGTVLLLELARLIANVDTEYSLKLIHFSGEEDGLIGSSYYVNNTVIPENMDIKLVFNIDEVGGVAGLVNDTVTCERDESNPSSNNAASNDATNILATCMQLYSSLNTEISYAYASDYIPFENNGEVITGLFEKNESPTNHSPTDDLAHMDVNYAFEVTKGAIGAALEFVGAYDAALGLDPKHVKDSDISLYPNPASKVLNISFEQKVMGSVDFRLIDITGKEVIHKTLLESNEQIKVDTLSNGTYLAVFKIENQRLIKKVILD